MQPTDQGFDGVFMPVGLLLKPGDDLTNGQRLFTPQGLQDENSELATFMCVRTGEHA